MPPVRRNKKPVRDTPITKSLKVQSVQDGPPDPFMDDGNLKDEKTAQNQIPDHQRTSSGAGDSQKENRQNTPDDDELASEVESVNGNRQKTSQNSSPTFQGGYDALKSFNGQVYKGMQIGGKHLWNYDPGQWSEEKIEPDLWKIDYATKKRRAKNAPKGSGAPVDTEYHWLIVAHQYVKKLDANTYETHLVGSKYKLAHKNATSTSWSINSVKGQRDREIELLDDAKRRVQGLPPVLGSEKVKTEKHEKGQQRLESLFSKASAK